MFARSAPVSVLRLPRTLARGLAFCVALVSVGLCAALLVRDPVVAPPPAVEAPQSCVMMLGDGPLTPPSGAVCAIDL